MSDSGKSNLGKSNLGKGNLGKSNLGMNDWGETSAKPKGAMSPTQHLVSWKCCLLGEML